MTISIVLFTYYTFVVRIFKTYSIKPESESSETFLPFFFCYRTHVQQFLMIMIYSARNKKDGQSRNEINMRDIKRNVV